jgi:hypothetical protein
MPYGKAKQSSNFGWVVEMRIPYAALRFLEKKNKLGVFFREIKRSRQYTWNFIDSKLGTFTQQTGS